MAISERLEVKVAVVTGASRGIGAGIARGLADAGASVVVNDASSKAAAERVVSEIIGNGGRAAAVHGDVSKAADVKGLFEVAIEVFGRPDVLVDNAGVRKFGPFESIAER